jgi:hypothetical protein
LPPSICAHGHARHSRWRWRRQAALFGADSGDEAPKTLTAIERRQAAGKVNGKRNRENETPEERAARKAKKKEKKGKKRKRLRQSTTVSPYCFSFMLLISLSAHNPPARTHSWRWF